MSEQETAPIDPVAEHPATSPVLVDAIDGAEVVAAIAADASTSPRAPEAPAGNAENLAHIPESIVPESIAEAPSVPAEASGDTVQDSEPSPSPEAPEEPPPVAPAPPEKGWDILFVMDQEPFYGQSRPAEITEVFADDVVNLLVYTSGRIGEWPTLTRTSVPQGTGIEPGTWHFPPPPKQS